jgi:hypothetical protein
VLLGLFITLFKETFSWLYEIPLLAFYSYIGYLYVPHFIEVAYGNIIQYSG